MAGREREVKVTVVGEDKGASKALNQVDQAAAKLGPSGKIAENALQSVTSKLTSGLGPASGQAKDALDKVGGSAISSGGMLTTALAGGALVAGAALAKFAMDGVGALVDLAGEVRNFGRATGLSAEDSSRMVAVLDDLGISSDVGAAAMFKLAKNAADGGEKLAQYGISVGKTKEGNLDLVTTLANVADAYVGTQDQGKRAELVMAAFGKAGQNLIPILEKGSAGFTAMFDAVKRGEILSQKQLDDTRKFELAIDDVQDSFRSLKLQGGEVLMPYITSLANAGTKTLDFIDNTKSHAGGLADALGAVLSAGTPLGNVLGLFSGGNKDAAVAAEAAAAKFDLEAIALSEMGIEVSEGERKTGELTAETKKAAAEAEKYKAKIEAMASSVGSAYTTMSGKSAELSEKVRDQARAYDTAKMAADSLKQGLDILTGVKINATRATITWEEKLRSTSETLRENKATLDITTEAGRANTTAIFDMIQAGNSHVEALQREGASSEVVSAAYGDHVAALRNVMHQAGYTDAQIEALLNKYNLLAAAPDINKNIGVHTTYTSSGKPYTVGSGENAYDARGDYYALGMEKGPIPGARNQAVPIMAHGGEWVVTPEQMSRLKGSAAGGDGASYAGGGGVYVVVNVAGSVVTERELVEAVQAGLLQKQRRVPTLGLT